MGRDTSSGSGIKGLSHAIEGSHCVTAWVEQGLSPPPAYLRQQNWQVLEIGYITVHNVYLSPYSSSERIKTLKELQSCVQAGNDKPVLVMGDFNLAPQPGDGMYGATYSEWTDEAERKMFAEFLSKSYLEDSTVGPVIGKQEFTIERRRGKTTIAFRCDLALVSDCIAPIVSVRYDHSSRSGPTRFTDHSAIIIDIPITLPKATLFPDLVDWSLNDGRRLSPHKTAIPRKGPSRIAKDLVHSGVLSSLGVNSILDYGCGHGQDVSFYRSVGFQADGYDPHAEFGFAILPEKTYDLVTVVFVVNVLPNPWERMRVLRAASEKVNPKGCLLVVARSPKAITREAEIKGWMIHNDGFWSHEGKGTFQKGVGREEIVIMLRKLGFVEQQTSCNFGQDTTCVLARRDAL